MNIHKHAPWMQFCAGRLNFYCYFSEKIIFIEEFYRFLFLSGQNLKKFVGDEVLQKVINFALRYMSELILPCKRYDCGQIYL